MDFPSFTDDQVDEITEPLGLDRDGRRTMVAARVREAATVYLAKKDTKATRPSTSKKRLEKITKRCHELKGLLAELDPDTLSYLGVIRELGIGDREFVEAIRSVENLERLIEENWDAIPKDKGGSLPNEPLIMFVVRLGRIFAEATGNRPTHTITDLFDEQFDPPEERFISPFDKFVFTVMRVVDPEHGKGTVANAIKKARNVFKNWQLDLE